MGERLRLGVDEDVLCMGEITNITEEDYNKIDDIVDDFFENSNCDYDFVFDEDERILFKYIENPCYYESLNIKKLVEDIKCKLEVDKIECTVDKSEWTQTNTETY
jgi:hypothetical protein